MANKRSVQENSCGILPFFEISSGRPSGVLRARAPSGGVAVQGRLAVTSSKLPTRVGMSLPVILRMSVMQQLWRGLKRTAFRLNARWGKPAQHLLRWGVPLLLLAFLGYALTQLGWGKIVDARPSGLDFYIVVLLPFFVQPIADLIIYRNLLGVGRALPLVVLFRKRYMNGIMLDYSGEVYFFFWARKNLRLKKGLLLHAVKDTNVLSASAALATVLLMLLLFVVTGGVRLPAVATGITWVAIVILSLPLILGIALFTGGKKITALSRADIATTFGIHFARCIIKLSLEFAIWWFSGALPSAVACFQFVALRLLVTRLPMVPNKDLVFVGVGLAAAGVLNVSAPKVAAVLVIMTAVGLIQDLVLVGVPWLLEQFQVRRSADQTAS